jgi:glycosyltransferase involved in cell wall biosynthesis
LLFVGRLVTEKGVDVAIDALQLLKDQGIDRTLTICGDGSERAAMERRVRQLELQDRVTFNGWSSSEELAVLYREAEVLLVPSRHEPFGIVALEALASRCPVVVSNVDGLPEAVGDCGLLVQPEDPEALADAAIRGLRDDVREELQAAMPAHANRHRTERIATDYLHVLRAARAST